MPLVLFLLIALACSGCSFTKDPQSYMRMPKLPDDKENLKQVIQQAMPAGASFIHPKNSSDPGSIYLKDLDKDGVPEAIVFYQTPDKDVRVKGMLWQKSGDSWKLLSEMEGEGYELDTLLFEDVTGDGVDDILVGYSGGARINKGLVVYHLVDRKLTILYQAPYTELVVDDLNQDNKKDISILTLERNVSAKMSTLQYDHGFQPVGSIALDPYVNGYSSVTAGFVAENKRGLLLDAGVGAHSSTTQLVYFDNGQLVKAFPDDKLPLSPRSAKSGDYNHDGIMEIPIDVAPQGSENAAYAVTPWITQYYRWDGRQGLGDTPLYERYYDYENSFYLDIPSEWRDRFSVQRSADGTRIAFVSSVTGETLADWKTMPADSWDASDPEWKEIGRTDKTVTALRLTENSKPLLGSFHPVLDLERQELSDHVNE
ncbi:hypothetical protein [Paenibacillus konkukensis]|nr:hypothetical protein [Paenibacillus konkukensis]